MSDILRQIDEDLRKDKLQNIWRSYRIYIIGSILTLIISLSAYQFHLSNTQSKNESIVEDYINAVSYPDEEITISRLIELDQSSNSYIKGLAKLKRADLYFSSEKKDQALELLESISKDGTLDQVLRDLALYKSLMLQLDTLEKDSYIEIIDIHLLTNSKFNFLLKELKAIKFLIEGDQDSSLEIFDSIIMDTEAPNELKIRSEKFKSILNK